MGAVPTALKRTLREGSWRHFVTLLGREVHYDRFADFVVTPPTAGLGATFELLKRVVADDPEAADLLDQALQNPKGQAGHVNRSSDRSMANVDIVNVIHSGTSISAGQPRPTGNARDVALRRLRKDLPELHAKVVAGKLSAHAAMVQAGLRPKTFTIRADSPEAIAASLRRHLDPGALAALCQLLAED